MSDGLQGKIQIGCGIALMIFGLITMFLKGILDASMISGLTLIALGIAVVSFATSNK